MKYLVSILLLLLTISNGNAQDIKVKAQEIIKKEINNKNIDCNNFNRELIFKDENNESVKITAKKFHKIWRELKKQFYETDYIVNEINQRNNNNEYCFVVYNHRHKILVTIDSSFKIIEVEKVFIEIPDDAPREE